MQKGFTLIELMVVIALIFLLSSLTFPMSYGFFQKSAVRDQARNIESSLRKAQAVAITNGVDSNSGIKISETGYTLFEGESYSSRRSAMDIIFNFPVAVSAAGAQEILFQKTTGLPIFPGMIGHWDLNEEAGDIAYNSSYLSQNNGTVLGSWNRTEGKDKGALDFEGDAYINVGNNPNLNPENGITVSVWVKVASVGDERIVRKGNPGAGTGYSLSFSDEGAVIFSFGDGASVQTVSNNYSSELLGEWTYIAAVWDGQTIKQYINGEEQPETKSFSGSIGESGDNLIIGEGLTGEIDDIRLYSYALSGEDVKTNYLIRKDDVAISLRFGEDRNYIIINSQGRIESTND